MRKKIYFASDFHLGVDAKYTSSQRERQIVRWLDQIKADAEAIYLVGDIFDFWFEYKEVIPRGYTRLLGKLAEISDMDVPIHLFLGNHDMWMFNYFEQELNIPVHRQPIIREHHHKRFFIAHGDGLGPGDYGYKMIKKVFSNSFFQWLFARLHPNFGIALANFWSRKSRESVGAEDQFLGEDKEWLLLYAEKKSEELDIDYFIFGHRHLPIDYTLTNQQTRYINLGDWMHHYSYGVFDGNEMKLNFFENEGGTVYKK